MRSFAGLGGLGGGEGGGDMVLNRSWNHDCECAEASHGYTLYNTVAQGIEGGLGSAYQ